MPLARTSATAAAKPQLTQRPRPNHPHQVAVHLAVTLPIALAARELHVVQWHWNGHHTVGAEGIGLPGAPDLAWRVIAIYDEPKDVLRQQQAKLGHLTGDARQRVERAIMLARGRRVAAAVAAVRPPASAAAEI